MSTGGRVTRTQVSYLGNAVPGLFVRTTNDGRTKFEIRVGGRRQTLAATTVSDAVREQRKELAKRDRGESLIGRSDMTLRELRDEWETWARGKASPYAASTVEDYLDALDRRALRLLGGETKAAAVRPVHLRGMIDKLRAEGKSGSTVHGTLTALSAMFRFAIRREILEANPVRLLERGDRPSTKRLREPRYLDRAEIDRLLAKTSNEFRTLVAVLAFAGLRVGEALALTWRDVDLDAGTMHVRGTKTAASNAVVPLVSALVRELRAHRRRYPGVGDTLVFRTATGRPQDRHNVARALRSASTAAGLNPKGAKKVAPHDLRHSCAGLLLAAGVPVPRVAAIMRHADPRVTLAVYGGLVETQRAELRADLEAALR
jgi:integrase